jgi:cation-transporting ATPase G
VLGLAAVILTHELAEVLVIANGVRAGRRAPAAPLPTADRQETEPVREAT